VLLAALLPTYLHRRPLSLPMILVTGGAVAFALLPATDLLDPRQHLSVTAHATELGVLTSLLGAGLALDRAPGWKSWATTWRLLSVGMLATIAGIAVAAAILLDVDPAAALLLGAAIRCGSPSPARPA
jgi:sodium/hydrogen antiporter